MQSIALMFIRSGTPVSKKIRIYNTWVLSKTYSTYNRKKKFYTYLTSIRNKDSPFG